MEIDYTADYHMHSKYSDGTGTLEENIKSAISKKLTKIALTDHAPLPWNTSWAIKFNELDKYFAEASQLKVFYSKQIKISLLYCLQ